MNRLLIALGAVLLFGIAGAGFGYSGTEGGGVLGALMGGTGGALVAVLVLVAVDSFRRLSGSSILLVGGLIALFLGERMLVEGFSRMAVSGIGLVMVLGSVGLRASVMLQARDRLREAHRFALIGSGLVLFGLGLYGLTTDTIMSALLTDDDLNARVTGALGAVWPIFVLIGVLPVVAVDRIIGLHPMMIPPKISSQAFYQALSAGLAVCLVFPVNYLATQYATDSDFAYFRTTRAGSATKALAASLTEPVEITLFFSAGSDVGREIEPYFAALAEAGGGMLKVTTVDQALSPMLAEELKVRQNGYIAIKQGDGLEKFKVGTDLKKAKRKLKKLDETVQKNLLKVAKGQRKAYFVVGHGEANYRERADKTRKLSLFKKVLESQNFKTGNLGTAEGLANQVPDDADVLILPAPTKPLMPEEVESLTTYLDEGGALFVMADPGGDPMTGLLDHLGVSIGSASLAHATAHLRQSRGPGDNILLATNRYGSHAAVKTLSKNGTTLTLVVPSVVSVQKQEKPPGKVNTLVRSFPDTWADERPNRVKDASEVSKVWDIAVASTGPERTDPEGKAVPGWRAIVVGDVNWASDPVIQYSQGNQVFLLDGVRWLLGEESLAGETSNEEDVKIQHTRDEDWAWFFLTVIGMPLLVLGLGFLVVMMRRKS